MIATQEVEIPVKLTPVFDANKAAYESGLYRRIINEGGARSSKSTSIMQLLITIALEEDQKPESKGLEISVTSPSLPHLKKGARKDFLDIMEEWRLFREENFNRTDNQYRFGKSYIEFFGVEDATKVRGPGRDILFCNELNLINEAAYRQLALRTKRVIFADYNPADEFSYVYPLADGEGSKIIRSSYRNNRGNLHPEQIKEIEALRDLDANAWNVFGLGLRGTSSEIIFTHYKMCKELPGRGERAYGQDFGYNVPSALVELEFWEGGIWEDELLYETKLTTSDLIERYKELGISRTAPIYCDNAEPKTIEEIQRAGYNALPANKAVLEGIRFLKSIPWHITERSTNIIKEARSYKWRVDPKTGKAVDEPVKFNDHAMDATRYGAFTKLSTPEVGWEWS
jgi:phage terminase large subunit